MKVHFQEVPIFIRTVKDHIQLKPSILEGISQTGLNYLRTKNESLFNTDWHLAPEVNRPYLKYIEPVLLDTVKEVNAYFNYPSQLNVQNYWFQQYAIDDFHDWHIHEKTVFSSVYYVDLPNGAAKTTFKLGPTEFEIDVQEGDVLTTPSCFLHCSKPNKVGHKTVIAFNM